MAKFSDEEMKVIAQRLQDLCNELGIELVGFDDGLSVYKSDRIVTLKAVANGNINFQESFFIESEDD